MKAPLAAILICLGGHVAATTCTPGTPEPQVQDTRRRPALALAAQAPAPRNTPPAKQSTEPPPEERQMLLAGVILMLAIALRHHGNGSR